MGRGGERFLMVGIVEMRRQGGGERRKGELERGVGEEVERGGGERKWREEVERRLREEVERGGGERR